MLRQQAQVVRAVRPAGEWLGRAWNAARDRGSVWARRLVRAARSASSRRPAAELLPLVLLLLMLALTLALWSEVRIAQGTAGRSATWVLWGGLIASAVVSTAAWAAVRFWRQEQESTRQYLAALESLHGISSAISAQLNSG